MNRALCALALLFTFAGSVSAETLDRIAVVVDNEVITLSEVKERAAARSRATPPGARALSQSAAMAVAVDELISEKLLEKQLEELNVGVSEAEMRTALEDVMKQNGLTSMDQLQETVEGQGLSWTEYRDTMKKQLAQMKLVNLKVRSQVKVSEDEVKRRYAERAALERGEPEVKASHLVVLVGEGAPEADVEAAKARAAALAKRAREGENFAALVKAESEGPSRENGGDLGWFRRGEMVPELEAAAFALEVGQVSEPIRTRFGFHVVRVDDKRTAEAQPLPEVQDQLREQLYREEVERMTQRYLDDLRGRALIEYKMAGLEPPARKTPPTSPKG